MLRKLCKAFSDLEENDWDDLPGTTNPVESINLQSVPENVKSVSLRPLIEHFYLEDKRHAIMQVVCDANVTISYHAIVSKGEEVFIEDLQKHQRRLHS